MLDVDELRKKVKNFELVTSADGTQLFLRNWNPNPKKETVFLILHGITAHSEPYSMIGQPIANAGYPCYGLDLRGHGLSDGPRGDYENITQFYEDTDAVLNYLKSMHKQIVLIGHSMGVLTAGYMATRRTVDLSGMVLLSAARRVREGAYPKRKFTTTLKILFWSIIKPSKPVIHYYREGIRGLDDPLFNFYYTLRFIKIFSVKALTFPDTISYPVFVGVGDNDELFDETATKELFNELPSEDKTFEVLPDSKHAYFAENSFDSLFRWIFSHYN